MLLAVAIFPLGAAALETSLSAPGASKYLQDRLRQGSSVLTAESRGLDTPLELISAALSDYRTLVQILYDQGYFSPVVNILLDGQEAANIDPLATPASISRINIRVETGPLFQFGKAEIGPLAPGTVLPKRYAPGQTATTGAIRDAASAAVLGWKQVGHAKAAIGGQSVTANHTQSRLNAQIAVAPDRQLTFGKMNIQGDTDVKPTSIAKIAGFPTGEVYSPAQVQKVGTRLRRTGTFKSVSIQEDETANPDGSLDFTATFEDLPKRQITFGAELSSSNGIDVSAIWIHRNLFRGAERFQAEATLRNIGGTEDIDGRIGFRLDRPDTLGPDDSTFYRADIERRNRTHYDSLSGVLAIGVRRTFSSELYVEGALGYNYIEADDAFGSDRKFRYAMLNTRAEWDKRDSKINATRGFFLESRFTPFAGLSGTKSGARLTVDSRAYWDMGTGGNVVLAGRVQIGAVAGPTLSETAPDLLFFSGGAGTVRGQPYESLGIPVGTGVAGGRSFLGFSGELRGKVTEKISLVGFFDIGAVDSSSFVTSTSLRHSGAGLGVRYDLGGFGPLRFDLAYPVEGTTGDGLQFYLGIGQAF
ncbi:MAG: BamA/TamA family outer membrane protein [Pseudomonadota bacterium]